MSSLSCLELQQSARTNRVGRSAAGCWQLAPGRALSLRLQTPGALRVARGRAGGIFRHRSVLRYEP